VLEARGTSPIVATTLILAVGVVVLVARGEVREDGFAVPDGRAEQYQARPIVAESGTPVGVGKARIDVASASMVEGALGAPTLDRQSEARFGSIEGVVHDALGYPSAGQLWVFRHTDGRVRERRIRSSSHGTFALRDVRVGRWEAFFAHEHPSVQTPMSTGMAQLAVSEDQVTWIELHVPGGTRSLYGEYVLRVDDASHVTAGGERVVQTLEQDLDLELRAADSSGGRISSGTARVVGFPGGSPPARCVQVPEQDERPPLRKGAFYFGGLDAGHYVLRVVPSGNESVRATFDDGEVHEVELGIERGIDLMLGDVVLDAEVLSMVDDFVRPALERESER